MLRLHPSIAAITAAIACVAAAGTASAADTPKDIEACLGLSLQLAGKAEAKGLSGDNAELADNLLEKLEGQCDAKDFKAAAKTAGELEDLIGG